MTSGPHYVTVTPSGRAGIETRVEFTYAELYARRRSTSFTVNYVKKTKNWGSTTMHPGIFSSVLLVILQNLSKGSNFLYGFLPSFSHYFASNPNLVPPNRIRYYLNTLKSITESTVLSVKAAHVQ
jgi:hypothetical protein